MEEKHCGACAHLLPTTAFGRNRARHDGLQSQCRRCKRVQQRAWYGRHQAEQAERTNGKRVQRRRASREKLFAYLQSAACLDCGETHPACLDFDHVRGEKTMAVSTLVRRGYAWKTIEREILKCDVRCANCHRKRTAREQRWYADLKSV